MSYSIDGKLRSDGGLQPVVEVSDLRKDYRMGAVVVRALRGVSLGSCKASCSPSWDLLALANPANERGSCHLKFTHVYRERYPWS